MSHGCILPISNLSIHLVGVGGNGSKVLMRLKQLALAYQATTGHQIKVTAYDPDTVSPSNLARQNFFEADIGCNKALVLINRLNLYCNLNWAAVPHEYGGGRCDILISCVDNRESRAFIAKNLRSGYIPAKYWMDLGNGRFKGQFLLGQTKAQKGNLTLPLPSTLFPELVDTSLPVDDVPSCSVAESLLKQDLLINDALATQATNLLWRLLSNREISYHGGFVNLETGQTTPLPVDRATWRRLKGRGKAG